MLVRFAGNEKGVAFQIKEASARLKNAEVQTDDTRLWQTLAAAPFWSDYPNESRASVLPGDLLKVVPDHSESPIWQIGALDGRIRMRGFETTSAQPTSLMQRIKQQLDPREILPRIHMD